MTGNEVFRPRLVPGTAIGTGRMYSMQPGSDYKSANAFHHSFAAVDPMRG